MTFFTDDDKEILWDLKQYLINTGNPVPADLAKHPSAQTNPKEAIPGAKKRDAFVR